MANKNKKAFVTGVTGQDGSYLAELLLAKGYEVHGLVRRSSLYNTARVNHLYGSGGENETKFFLHYGDLTDASSLSRIIRSIQPDEVYNLGAQSHVRVSFDMPSYTAATIAEGTLNLLEAIRAEDKNIRFYQASSSEMYGKVREIPQSEDTGFYPRSPYGCSKVAAYWYTVNYREAFDIFACNGILFNHESPRRGESFVTRKITQALARIIKGDQKYLYLGNLDAKRDWGYAKEYVEAMWLMLQAKEPEDYVIATGETHSVAEFLNECCTLLSIKVEDIVRTDARYFRAAEVDLLVGDPSKAKNNLGWEAKVRFKELTRIMLSADLAAVGIDPKRFGLAATSDHAINTAIAEASQSLH